MHVANELFYTDVVFPLVFLFKYIGVNPCNIPGYEISGII